MEEGCAVIDGMRGFNIAVSSTGGKQRGVQRTKEIVVKRGSQLEYWSVLCNVVRAEPEGGLGVGRELNGSY